MRINDSQSFLSLFYEPGRVEIATGDRGSDKIDWKGNTRMLGQIATPLPVASLMARWVMSHRPKTVLDPAIGRGALLAACQRFSPAAELVGVERDPATFSEAKSLAPGGTKLILTDYLLADAGKFEGIIANPPYVKAHRLGYGESQWRFFEERFGTTLDRLTNLYALFLLKIWEDLSCRGRAAVLIPAEFLNANFGEEIKLRLLRAVRPAGTAIFSSAVNLFSNALTTSAILFLDKAHSPSAPLCATRVDSIAEAEIFLENLLRGGETISACGYTDLSAFEPREKWLNVFLNTDRKTGGAPFQHRVGNYFSCSRGIATGANDYFCLAPTDLRKHGLNLAHVKPCLTKATDASGYIFSERKFESLVAADRRCYLFSPRTTDRSVAEYLAIGEARLVPERHLPSHRSPWYMPEKRHPAAILAAVFSRGEAKFILNTSGTLNLTCFHGLYAKDADPGLAPLLTLFLNSSWGRESFLQVNRFYGGGLNKLEPKDVEAMPCPNLPKLSPPESEKLIDELLEIEEMTKSGRVTRIDKLLHDYFGGSNTELDCRVTAEALA